MTMQSSLEAVVKTALIGTGRDAGALALEGPIQAFVEQTDTPETALLNACAVVTLCARAGTLPAKSEGEAPTLCPPETRPYFSQRAASLLESCLNGQRDLAPQALSWASQSGRIVPPSVLPTLLDLGRGSKELRRSIAPILGERGRWLAQQNPDWKPVAAPLDADLESSWQEGELAARREALRLKRELEPQAARQWIEAALVSEGAKERAEWLGVLQTNLSQDDEPPLERALDDKSKDVRAAAVSLLEQLPDSRLVARAKAELERLLRWNVPRWNLLKRNSGTVEVELPAAWRREWARDGLEEKVSAHHRVRNLGERAAWLHIWLCRVPCAHWEQQWRATPAQIVAGAPSEWRELLFRAWWSAARAHQELDWSLALLSVSDLATMQRLFGFQGMAAPFADALSLALFERDDAGLTDQNPLLTLLQGHPGPWSLELARRFLREVQAFIPLWSAPTIGNTNSRWLFYALPAMADKMPVELASEAAQGWPETHAHWEQWSPVVSQFLTRLQLRADLQTELSAPSQKTF